MKLFFIAHDNDDGQSMDWFVAANDRAEAVAVWQRDNSMDPGTTEDPSLVFHVACATLANFEPKARLLGWHSTGEIPSV